ncbi:hypothetical protein [Pseudanabaena sp. PCC 6802]|nr:hypothetical protein [Pseudanabaena sp. PCC 6802]
MTTDQYVAYIGIDWADRKHDIALYDCASGTGARIHHPNSPPRPLGLG